MYYPSEISFGYKRGSRHGLDCSFVALTGACAIEMGGCGMGESGIQGTEPLHCLSQIVPSSHRAYKASHCSPYLDALI
jgi:hypothetical protein